MGIGDDIGVKAVEKIDKETLPELQTNLQQLVAQLQTVLNGAIAQLGAQLLPEVGKLIADAADKGTADLHSILDRIDGAQLTFAPITVSLKIPNKQG